MAGQEWIGIEQLAEEIGVPIRTVYKWRVIGTAPRGATFGRHVRFRRADVDAWIEQRSDTPQPAA
jgi:excisionase family DNA binding protein